MIDTITIKSGRNRDGEEIIIDAADYHLVAPYRWSVSTKRGSHTKYVFTRSGGYPVYLHRMLMEAIPGVEVDHIDGNGMNNSRANLRLVTHAENIKAAYDLPGRFAKPKKDVVLNTVRRTLADGTVREYVYDRVSGKRVR